MLISALLPKVCPTIVKEQLDSTDCYRRVFTFFPEISLGHSYRCLIPPGLWGRLLSSIINNIKEVKDMLNQQVIIDISIPTDASLRSNTSVEYNLSSNCLIYWCTGLFFRIDKLFFVIESFAETDQQKDNYSIKIIFSLTPEGCKVFCQLVDLVQKLICDWYPGMVDRLCHVVPCHACIKAGSCYPYMFKVRHLLRLLTEHKFCTQCDFCHSVQQIIDLIPDFLLTNLDQSIFPFTKANFKQNQDGLLQSGTFGKVYHGKYKDQSVAIRLYTARELDKLKKYLQSECWVVQQSHHPCLAYMALVISYPIMSVVLEEAPHGPLQIPLLIEKCAFSRIVMYHIAIQVASALHYLHSSNIICNNFKVEHIFLWSLPPNCLINCKVTDFNVNFAESQDFCSFIDPIASAGGNIGHRMEIFSLGLFFYQLIARRHPFHNVNPRRIKAAIEAGQRPQLEDIPVAETGLFCMTRIMKLCWEGSANDQPNIQRIIEWLSTPLFQLIMSVISLNNQNSVSNGCIVTPACNDGAVQTSIPSELWIYCDKATKIDIFNSSTMVKVVKHSCVNKIDELYCIEQSANHVWMGVRGGVYFIKKGSMEPAEFISTRQYVVSCITVSDQLVCMGTVEGYCFASTCHNICNFTNFFPSQTYDIHVAENCLDGILLIGDQIWISSGNQIYLLNPTLEPKGMVKRKNNKHACVGKMMLCDNGDEVWSAHLGGVIMSSWDAHQHAHLCDVDVGVIAEEKCNVGDPRNQIITAMCTGLDTVWIGLASGHIIVFGMNPPGEVLTYFRPYQSYVCFLSSANYPGPCGKEECMMLSGGKTYQPDDSFKELSCNKDKSGHPVDTAGVAILWEVLPAKYVRQVHYLRDGKAWSNYDKLRKAMEDTRFTKSMKYCKSSADKVTSQS